MPFSRSRSFESMTRSATSWLARNAPDCHSSASTSVVLPWSTWATMARLRRSERAGMATSEGEAFMLPMSPPYPGRRMTVDIGIVPDATVERHRLDDESWVDVTRGWLHGADELYDLLSETVPWQQGRVFKYERYADEPRVGSWYDRDTPYPHPALTAAHRAIQHQYRVTFGGV